MDESAAAIRNRGLIRSELRYALSLGELVYFLSKSEHERQNFTVKLNNLFETRNNIIHADINSTNEVVSKIFHDSLDIFIKAFIKEMRVS